MYGSSFKTCLSKFSRYIGSSVKKSVGCIVVYVDTELAVFIPVSSDTFQSAFLPRARAKGNPECKTGTQTSCTYILGVLLCLDA